MSYNVKNTTGNTLVVIPDRHIDRDTTSLALVGFNATDYGLDHAENFVHLLEHFANDVAPDNPITGQLWFDTSINTLKAYYGGTWSPLSKMQSVGADPEQGGVSGIFHCPVGDTSMALIFAGGQVVAIVAARDISKESLPETVDISNTSYVVRERFHFGLQGGVTLADSNDENNPDDFVFSGRVPLAEQSHFTGGGIDDAQVSGWGYIDIGPNKSVGLMISCGQIIAAVSAAPIASIDLPNSISFYVRKDRDTGTGSVTFTGEYKGLDANYNKVICSLKSRFPAQTYKVWGVDSNGLPEVTASTPGIALFPGMTFAQAVGTNGGINQTINSLISQQSSVFGQAIATASDSLKTWVDETSATAMKVTQLSSEFTSATGTQTVAEAVQALITRSGDGTAIGTAVTNLKAEITNGLGESSFSSALSKLNVTASLAAASAQDITSIKSTFVDKFGGSNFAEAINNLYTKADSEGGTVAGWGLSLNSNGYVTGVQALNGGASNNYFKVTTSNFIIGDNNVDFIPFQVKDGVVYIKSAVIENLSITGDKVANNAITEVASWRGNLNGYRLTSTAWNAPGGTNNPVQVVINTGSGASKVVLHAYIIWQRDGGDDDNLNMSVQRIAPNGTITYLDIFANLQVFGGKRPVAVGWVDDTAAADTVYRYRLCQQYIGSDGSPYYYNVSLIGVVYKK